MKLLKLPALVLAMALHLAPVARVVCVTQAAPSTGFAIILKCFAGAAALLGTYHAVSAASAAITGVSRTNPLGPVTTNAAGTLGQAFSYRIVVTNPGTDHAQDFWNAAPLPPGLIINTNIGGNGFITGTPTTAGTFPVTLTAGNANSDIVVHLNITITIQGTVTSLPPVITGPPTNQIAPAGATVTFSVQATGGTLYQWLFNGRALTGATSSTLTLSNVATNQSGIYSVSVSNGTTSVPSPGAQLLVVTPPTLDLAPNLKAQSANFGQVALSFTALPGYRYRLQWRDSPASGTWTDITNVPPSLAASDLAVMQDASALPARFYRIQVTGN